MFACNATPTPSESEHAAGRGAARLHRFLVRHVFVSTGEIDVAVIKVIVHLSVRRRCPQVDRELVDGAARVQRKEKHGQNSRMDARATRNQGRHTS